nr:HisA/HisF-related TIM barrel protein [Pseudomonadales bacterium]
RDGSRNGYDLELVEQVAPMLGIPVTVCGGAGHPADMEAALAMDSVSAVAAANFFHHSEQSVSVVKSWLRNANAAVRGEYHAMYRSFAFSDDGRPLKRPESDLGKLIFEPIEGNLA